MEVSAYVYDQAGQSKGYKAGTRVLQQKDGKVYACKPYPYSGWCTVWSATSSQYEPGVGAYWKDAWTLQ